MRALTVGAFARRCWGSGGPLIVAIAAVLLAIGTLGELTNGYTRYLLALAACYSLAVLSVGELSARAGLVSFGHAGLVAVGAYVGAELGEHGVPFELAVVTVSVVGFALGATIGALATRFSVLYFAIITFTVGLTIEELIRGMGSLTGGSNGRPVLPMRFGVLQRDFDETIVLIAAVVTAAVGFLLAGGVAATRGTRWLAVKEDRLAAASIGIDARRELALAFALGGVPACVAGLLLSQLNGFLLPETFSLQLSLYFVAAVILGGPGSRIGAAVGAGLLVAVPEIVRNAPMTNPSNAGNVQIAIFGVLIVAVLMLMPAGVVPTVARLTTRRRDSRPVTLETIASPDVDALATFVDPAGSSLCARSITVRFGGVTALNSVDLDVPAGSVVGIIGPNGAGKTTLLNVLTGLTPIAAASDAMIRYGDVDLRRLRPEQRIRCGLARTFQHARLFPSMTVAESVGLASEASPHGKLDDERIDVLLHGLGLKPWADVRCGDLPFSVQTMADIARALAARPSMLILDEPFGGLDRTEAALLRKVLQGLHSCGLTMLIVDHVVSEIFAIADRIVVLNFGNVIRTGSVDEIRESSDVAEAYLGRSTW